MTLRSAVNIVVLRALIDLQPRLPCVSGMFRGQQKRFRAGRRAVAEAHSHHHACRWPLSRL